jgi:hypothetical protein
LLFIDLLPSIQATIETNSPLKRGYLRAFCTTLD